MYEKPFYKTCPTDTEGYRQSYQILNRMTDTYSEDCYAKLKEDCYPGYTFNWSDGGDNTCVKAEPKPARDIIPPPPTWKEAQVFVRYTDRVRSLDTNVDLFVPGKKIYIGDESSIDTDYTSMLGGNIDECGNTMKDVAGYYTISGYNNNDITLKEGDFYGDADILYGCVVNARIEP